MTVDEAVPRRPRTFWAAVEERAADTPDGVLVVDDLGRSFTARQFRDAAEAVAAGLAEHGVGAGVAVTWQLPTSIEAAVVTAALARLGAVQNPAITVLREREMRIVVDQVDPALVLVPGTWKGFDHHAMVQALDPSAQTVVVDHRLAAAEGGLALPLGDPAILAPPLPGGDAETRWIYYSSGTTSAPKGVRHTDTSVMAACDAMLERLRMGPDDLYPIAFPLSHIGGAAMLAMALRSGCTLALFDTFDASTADTMASFSPTLLGSALPFHQAYMAAQQRHGAEPLYPRLKACTSGGAAKPSGHHARVREVLGGAGVVSAWGLTEAPVVTQAALDDSDEQLDGTEGRPAPGVQIRAVAIDGHVCATGEEGELRVKGPQVCLGYVDPSLDADAFDAEGWFRTGDLGVIWPTGHVAITGRLKHVIVRNAENISGKEVEDVVLTCPAVADVAVLGVPDERTGERVVAVIVPADDAEAPSVAELGAHCTAQGLARYKTPEQVHVVTSIPRNAMGKVLVQDLRDELTA
ncbi:class I adenylate-forming enzyme family protein [Rhabdothermincola salaria]|uniref:class I adenylate-forming enzyme family protein n=1 Tax=Rhabdothermincola salaria TaxID=2903142 RepID=UPI001E2B99F5|nr:AMP-binding protein [Rhabdothermincola salaria]MCD9624067.1 AMP-binding protein [Rhabdothermincola salaria]